MKKAKSLTLKQVLGARVRHYRRAAGLTQEELAGKLKLSTNYIAHLERGSRGAGLGTIEAVARFFHVQPAAMLLPVDQAVAR